MKWPAPQLTFHVSRFTPHVSSFQLPLLGSPVEHFLNLAPAVAKRHAYPYTRPVPYPLLSPSYTPRIPLVLYIRGEYEGLMRGI